MTCSKETSKKSDLDVCLEKSISNLFLRDKELEKPHKHEEIITKYGEYTNLSNKSTTYIRNSLSLQNMLDVDRSTNSNNDFDNNSIIPRDKAYLIHESDSKKKIRNKSELDLIDILGNSQYDNHDKKGEYSGTCKKLNGKKIDGEAPKYGKSRSLGAGTQSLENGTLPTMKKKFGTESRNGGNNKKINEKSEALAKACTSKNCDKPKYSELQKAPNNDITIGTLVEISNDVTEEPLYGVIRWLGIENGTNFILAGVELENDPENLPLMLTDGTHNGDRLFNCSEKRALFVPIQQCHKDSRFQDGLPTPVHQPLDSLIDNRDCTIIKGCVAPLCMPTEEDVEAVCGKYKGIQGHHNSCYLDVTLFSMFTFTGVFDSLLFRPKGPNDIPDYEEVQRVLREEIVNPLRKNLYVSAGHVMNLRKLLDRLSSVSGLTSEEKDPEEFLNSLLAQILKADPFLKLNSGQEAFHYQLFVEKDADLTLPTVQQLFEQSFLTSNIKLKEVPSCLIIQMPRFGKNFKMYPRILPSQLLDVTDVIEESPRQCIVCGKVARYECRECFDFNNAGLASTAFCEVCLKTAHRHEKRIHHLPEPLDVSYDFTIMENHVKPPRLFMELFAVICIETSHYVAFVKCGVGHEAPWCFFDSMADRKGERNGYNIPEMVACPDISRWLSDEGVCRELHEEYPNDKFLPEHARRLLCDAYICMYQSSDVMMYR
ncbi:ubiquitin carboxyl-terminal hydrolase CYLD isoform X2 [Coccinella septempunctata]|nr:ubiquitin carboxyl-terminal hydrolase CYLD isoform X2 [Coccinella septempunctata]